MHATFHFCTGCVSVRWHCLYSMLFIDQYKEQFTLLVCIFNKLALHFWYIVFSHDVSSNVHQCSHAAVAQCRLRADFYEISRVALQWNKEQLIIFLGWSGSPCWLSKSWIRATLGNELPCRRSVLSKSTIVMILHWPTNKSKLFWYLLIIFYCGVKMGSVMHQ